ncbi:MAG: acyltransferase [Candidatus Devosia phytovorans]|uniref:Acyltransferase n=1 Tax=Candidatus Devosia phytovorans TaxID=3121372 RepID=A0AAJ6B2L1_9HYPH|nr:acyltransferase [Devosia sp.]WEK06624.1 MAG: acyltransferase [Devosia sp.]
MTQQRLLGADFLRAAACVLVLMHHLAFRMDMGNVPAWAAPVMDFFVMGSFGVSVFFVLSGFLLARPFWLAVDKGAPMPSLRTYALRRGARILPGFWVALILSFILSITVSGSPLDAERIIRVVAGFFLLSDWHWFTLFPVDNNGPLWSIGFEVTSYLLLPFFLAVLFALRLKGWAARFAWLGVIAMVVVLHLMVMRWAPIDEVERGWGHGLTGGAKAWMPRFNPIGFFAIFALGALAAGVQVKLNQFRHWSCDVIGLIAIFAAGLVMALHIGGLNEGFGLFDIPYGYPWMPLAICVALVALPGSVLVGRLLDNRPARFIAEISFGIYIWHFLIIGLMARLAPPAFEGSGENGWSIWLWSSAIAIALSVLVATLSFYLLERPMVRWARGLERKGETPSSAALSTDSAASRS